MSTTGSKFMFGSAILAMLAAFFVAISTVAQQVGMAELTGPISLGYKGPVGSHFAYAILVGYAAVAILIAMVLSITRDGDPDVGAKHQGYVTPVAVLPPRGTNYWPLIGAFGAGLVILGLVYSSALFILGLIAVGISTIQWAVYAWSDHATADPLANRKIRHELTYPLDFPLFAILAIALFVFALSRILLALPEGVDTAVFGGVPAVAFVVAIVLSRRPKLSKKLIGILAVVGTAIILALGIWGMVKGPKTVEKHENTPHPYSIKNSSETSAGAPMTIVIAGKEIR